MSEAALRFREVTVRYAPTQAPSVIDASFAVAAGERVALLGLNGSGKTTVLLTAVGLLAHRGEIVVGGLRLTRRTLAPIRERVGFVGNVPEDQLLLPTVVEDVALALLRRGVAPAAARERATATLATLGLAAYAETALHRLSHGQKQRVALAGALVSEPPLLLLDEPSAALDPPGRRALARLLATADGAMLVATHDLELAARLCTRFLVLDQGRIAFDGADLSAVLQRWALDEAPQGSDPQGPTTGPPPRPAPIGSVGPAERLSEDAAP